MRFTQSLAAAATCTPSRAALLTARYPIRQGMVAAPYGQDVILFVAQRGGLPDTEVTLAKVLVNEGYNTSYIGKWHLGVSCETYGDSCHSPNNHGFQYWYGMPLTNLKDFGDDGTSVVTAMLPNFFPVMYAVLAGSCMAAAVLRGRSRCLFWLALLTALLASATIPLASNVKLINSLIMRNGEVVEQPIRLVGLTQRFVAETKEKLAEYKQQNRPFFLLHAFSKVHTALATVPEFRGRSRHGLYGDSVLELDWAVGEILAELDRLGLADNTLVYLTSDNGGHLEERGVAGDVQGGYNGPLRGGKGMAGMEGGIRVPTLLRYPPLARPGSTIDAPVSQMDLFPTVLSVAGVDAKTYVGDRVLDGRDLTQLITGQSSRSPHEVMFHYCSEAIHALRWVENENTTWKVHFYQPQWLPGTAVCHDICLCDMSDRLGRPHIFNIQTDASEQRPLDENSAEYGRVLAASRRAAAQHAATLVDLPESQFSYGNFMWRPSLQPCCRPPWCTCTDPRYP
ncbi:steryl-sulfatase-like [Pollicipes pollicipes]|uniref:steryl-sulfatase-like n=1 Tax=Pollicipes pollicipes TaxID=41117 RepID=UPI0018852E63|nr:steryl-sulfatase-like [Pollicipes pollicipes]